MKQNKAFIFRLYPTTEQASFFIKTFGCCRLVYNTMLSERKESYKSTGKSSSRTPTELKKEFPFLKEVDSSALATEWTNLNSAYRNFFRDKKVGFPKFKSKKNDRKSYTTFNQCGTIKVLNGFVKLPKIGFIKCRTHREIPSNWKIKSATISKTTTNKYYISVMFETPEIEKLEESEFSIGLDMGLKEFCITSDGEMIANPRFYKNAQDKLAQAQRKLARTKKGSNRHEKARLLVAKHHEHIANQRRDFQHKLSKRLIDENQIIAVEDLNVKRSS